MDLKKTYNVILSIGVIGSLIMSIIYLLKSYNSLHLDNTNFIFNTSILFSNATSLVILIYLMRRTYFKNKKQLSLLFSKFTLFGLLLYITLPLEIMVYNLYKHGMNNYMNEKITSLLFGIACIMVTIYMIKGKDLKNNVA